ncbi:MAG: hypothetical protein P4L53_23275 [Candidatus Obscuribacterales bacterium]|nr:hypothetical protein [Candidatus Obscuribacterales bacterium]
MDSIAFWGPPFLLLVVVSGYLATVFEPYWAYHSKGGLELKEYHAQDLKLRLIAQWWAAKLAGHKGGYYDEDDENARLLCAELHDSLVRHRFIFGDDPTKLQLKKSTVLSRALKRAGWRIDVDQAADHYLIISPNLVKSTNGQVIWRGKPPEYKSRFNDMYYEWL